MSCHTPYYVDKNTPVPCGKCVECKKRRVSSWVYRLEQEDKISSCSLFITLTYNTIKVPITDRGFMTLKKKDLQDFMKRLRKRTSNKLKYYAVGEYGTKTDRPHYHMILFNLENPDVIAEEWRNGDVHIGKVSGASIAYTTKYIDKEKRIPKFEGDDRLKEFSLMSKGLGKNYLSEEKIKWHKEDINRNYVVREDGVKVALPRYYREKIYDEQERKKQNKKVEKLNLLKEKEMERKAKELYKGKLDGIMYEEQRKIGKYNKFYNSQKNRKL